MPAHRETADRQAEDFWNWFVQHEAELFAFEEDRERIFDQLATEIQKVDPNLTFEFGPKQAIREFVVSAGGIKNAFPAVVSLVNHAPSLDRWKVTAFRPRRSPSVVEFRGKYVDPSDVQFSLLNNGKTAGIYLFIPGFRDNDTDFKQIGYLLLDETLGEYDVESRVGLIKMLSPNTPTDGDRYPLADLPARFDKLVSQLEGKSGRPS
jgi:hypothetical protein